MARKILQGLYNFTLTQSKINYKNTKAVMKEVEIYHNTNMVPRKDAAELLEEYSSRMKWKEENAKILDVGCADGGVTVQVLKPYLPANFEKLIGCDISEAMIAHAKQNHKGDRTEFTAMDIAGDTTQFVGQFDHIFSFYTLHWIQEQQKALSNIYSMLVPGGDCLLLFICHNPIFNVYRIMANSSTWSQYMFDVENSISPYHDSQNPVEEYTNLMIKCGFKNVEVQCKNKHYNYKHLDIMKSEYPSIISYCGINVERLQLIESLRSVNPIMHRLSPDLKERFMEDYMQALMKEEDITKMSDKNEESEEIQIVYTLLLAYASK